MTCDHLDLDNAYREGRARYVCRDCGGDVSLPWVSFQLAKLKDDCCERCKCCGDHGCDFPSCECHIPTVSNIFNDPKKLKDIATEAAHRANKLQKEMVDKSQAIKNNL